MRDFTTKVDDTAPSASGILSAAEDNVRNLELEAAVEASGLTLDAAAGPDTATNMLAESMTRHASGALWCTDSGAADAYVATMTGAFVPPTELFEGLTIRMKVGNACTGASTLNAFGLGVKAVVDHVQGALISGVLDGRVAEFVYRASVGAGSWQVPAWSNALYVGTTPSSPPAVSSGEGWNVNGSNEGDLNFAGLTADAVPDPDDQFAFNDVADIEHKMITYAQLSALLGVGGGIKGVQVIAASGTYTKTAGTNSVLAFATGGGAGGGGGRGDAEAAGGGAGGTAIVFADLAGVPTVACTIGAGGSGGSGGSGGAGGSTAFGGYATATGGSGGSYPSSSSNAGTSRGGSGGVGTVGLMLIGGNSAESVNQTGSYTSNGGGSFWSGGGKGGSYPGGASPQSGASYGAGGGGGDGGNGGADQAGGAGAVGCVFIVEFG